LPNASFETSEITYPLTQRHIPQDQILGHTAL